MPDVHSSPDAAILTRDSAELAASLGVQAVASRLETITGAQRRIAFDDLSVAFGPGFGPVGVDVRLAMIGERLGLTHLEREVLAAVALPSVSPEHAAMLSALGGPGAGRRGAATPRSVARALAGPDRSAGDVLAVLDATGPLRRSGAVQVMCSAADVPGPSRPLVLAPRLLAAILGTELHDPTAAGRLRRFGAADMITMPEVLVAELRALLWVAGRPALLVHGPDAVAALIAAASPGGLLVVGAAQLDDDELRGTIDLTALLEDRVVVVDRLDQVPVEARPLVADRIGGLADPVIVVRDVAESAYLDELRTLTICVRRATAAERQCAWNAEIDDEALARDLAMRYPMPLARIADAACAARSFAAADGRRDPGAADLARGAREATTARMGEFARPTVSRLGWDDLVLADGPLELLRFLGNQMRQRHKVLDEWGLARHAGPRQGMVAMFCGESGTGKTLAAQVLATELDMELFRVDLALVVSKWVGETERNLERIFAAAESSSALVFFDEADVLFSKRGAVSDAHDRYANMETAYLLQRIESYDGAVILATNMRSNIDDAFLRRMDAIVEFPPATPDLRRRLWEMLLPAQAPRAAEIDLDFLADRFALNGGGIRNAVFAGAVLAAEEGVCIDTLHLVRGVAMEYLKLGRMRLVGDFAHYHEAVRLSDATGPRPAPTR